MIKGYHPDNLLFAQTPLPHPLGNLFKGEKLSADKTHKKRRDEDDKQRQKPFPLFLKIRKITSGRKEYVYGIHNSDYRRIGEFCKTDSGS